MSSSVRGLEFLIALKDPERHERFGKVFPDYFEGFRFLNTVEDCLFFQMFLDIDEK